MVPIADDFEPLEDQIRAYEEIGGGVRGGGGGRRGGGMSRLENATEQLRYLN